VSSSLYDSLVLGGVIELAGGPGGVPSTNPMCPGAVFALDPEAWDLGDPQPTQDFVATLSVDGERPFGTRTSDRVAQFSVFVKAPDFLTLAGARELLLKTIDAQQWTMVWTPRMTAAQITAGQLPLPVVYDCFRAKPSKKKWGGVTGFNNEPVDKIDVTFEALPYGRSDTQQQLAFASPIAALNAPAPPPVPVVLDAFTSINSTQFSQTSACVIGPFAGFWDPGVPPFSIADGAGSPLEYSNTFAAPLNLTGMTSLKLWAGLGSRYYFNHHPRGRTKIQLTYTLTDAAGISLSWTTLTGLLPVSDNPTAPAFSLIAARIPAATNGFDYSQVKSYSLAMVNRGPDLHLPFGEFRWTCITLDALTAYPSTTVAANPTVRGTIYDVHGVVGTHYAPVSVTAQSPPTAGSASVITATGAGNYTVPANTLYVAARAKGGGGPGATMTVAGAGGGGGGAEDAYEPQLPGSSTGVVIPYQVGTGGGPGTAGQATTFGPVPGQSLVVTAHGGQAAAANSAAGALGGDGSVNTGHYPGAAGHTASGGLGGGGGSSAGTAAPGNGPVGTTSQTFTSSSSFTIPSGAGQVTLDLTGASGGGAGGSFGSGGGGGECLRVTLTLPAGTYPFTIGAAGSAGSSGNSGGAGGSTHLTISGTTYTAHGGGGGDSSDFFGGGGGSGGSGSGEPGGDGGGGYPYSGGGGSSASPTSPGNDGDSYGNPGIAPTGGGNGGAGSGAHATSGSAGQAPGGGGGGAYQSGHSGGAGAAGQLKVSYSGSGAPTANGGVAPAGGGNGGAGGGSAGTTGSAGSQPGGGGGGGNSSGAAKAGGAGGDGELTITPYGFAAFSTLLLHRPGRDAPSQLSPLVPFGGTAPGSAEFPVPPITARTTSWGFEDGTTSSFTGIGAALTSSSAWANTGTKSLLATADGTHPGGLWGASSPAQPVAPGQFVTVTGVVKNPNGSTTLAHVKARLSWLGAGSSALSSTAGGESSISTGSTATVTVTGQAPAGAQSFTVDIIDGESSASTTTMGVDDLAYTLAPPAAFDGTYTMLIAFGSFNSPSSPRTLQVTVNQYEASGGTKWSVSTDTLTITPSTQVTNGLVDAGNLTLPYKALAKDNAAGYYTVQITDSNTSDTVDDLLILDNNGQTALISESGSGYTTYYIDEPDPRFDLGLHLGSQNGRPQAVSVTDAIPTLSGGPLTLEPGDNKLLAWSLAGAPALAISYFPRWFQERLE
jgi:hypothetical protein